MHGLAKIFSKRECNLSGLCPGPISGLTVLTVFSWVGHAYGIWKHSWPLLGTLWMSDTQLFVILPSAVVTTFSPIAFNFFYTISQSLMECYDGLLEGLHKILLRYYKNSVVQAVFLWNKTYYYEISCIFVKRLTLICLRSTKWSIETVSSNCFRSDSILAY